MRKTEEKEVVKKSIEKVTVGRICDFCNKEILPVDGKRCDYFYITTSHRDWGNDSVDSYEHYDACSAGCALGLADKYLNSVIGFRNTGNIEIEHVNNLDDGATRDYQAEIRY